VRHERDCAAAEPGAGHAGTEGTLVHGRLDDDVELVARDVEVVAQRRVRGQQEGADSPDLAGAQGLDDAQHPLVLTDDVPGPATKGLVEWRHFDLAQRGVTELIDTERGGGRLALPASLGVAAV